MYARRTVLKGAAGVLQALVIVDPMLASAAATDLQKISITTKDGRAVAASLALPSAVKAPTIVLIHEWWGLNNQIKAVASEFAKEGYVALAIDLYDGRSTGDGNEARQYMRGVKPAEATDTLASWVAWLQGHERSNGKVATIGWCFGGGWSLNASLESPVDATVIYYGNVTKKAAQLGALKGPVQGHFATRDGFINKPMVDGFAKEMKAAGKRIEVHWYEADHGFANPTAGRYDKPDAELAWKRTLTFLKANI
ncbi:MAG: dienelactone hydrolase family protein [Proteobacteria bacterium]|nr:dienelactone hydrolase family protein [Pseudomonadota bacterium]